VEPLALQLQAKRAWQGPGQPQALQEQRLGQQQQARLGWP
jgi:hypothetical protein